MSIPSPHRSAPYTLRQLECFVAIAAAGSISGAADALHSSDSAVADSLSALERALGAPLVKRRRARGVTLTSDGLAALPIARRLLVQAEEVAAVVGAGAAALSGIVRLGAVPTLAPVLVADLVARLRLQQPHLTLEFVVDEQPALIDGLARGDLDVVITFDIDVPPELSREALYGTAASVVLADGHPLAGRRSVQLAELEDEVMVLFDIALSRVHTLELMSNAGLTPRIGYRTSNYELCRSLVGQGLGYTLLMWRDTPRSTWDGRGVVFVPIYPSPRPVSVLAVWMGDELPSRVDFVVRIAQEVGSTYR